MVSNPRFPRRTSSGKNQSTASEAALALAFVIIIVLTMVMGTVLLLAFFDLLPAGTELVAVLSLGVFVIVLARAILNRALSTPPVYGRQLSSRRVIGPPGN
ncbi:MAG: hypothetical protein E4H03_04370 [Myxococcales bacterium]|jgi:fatty acid desaturase|nr:MAG: hypothetical protein E4H03_04370 [Myxococcales bacterium]